MMPRSPFHRRSDAALPIWGALTLPYAGSALVAKVEPEPAAPRIAAR